mgnify:CR=1 FL=1
MRAPTIDQKLRILHLLDRIGIDTAAIGLPGAGPHVVRDVERFGLVDLARIEKLVLTHIAGEFFRLPIDDDQEKPS